MVLYGVVTSTLGFSDGLVCCFLCPPHFLGFEWQWVTTFRVCCYCHLNSTNVPARPTGASYFRDLDQLMRMDSGDEWFSRSPVGDDHDESPCVQFHLDFLDDRRYLHIEAWCVAEISHICFTQMQKGSCRIPCSRCQHDFSTFDCAFWLVICVIMP